jgi:hypothetical protein
VKLPEFNFGQPLSPIERAKCELNTIRENLATKPDYAHWAKFDSWTVPQATALLLDYEPYLVDWELIPNTETEHLFNLGGLGQDYFEMNKNWGQLVHILTNSVPKNTYVSSGGSFPTSKPPIFYIDWAQQKDLAPPAELVDLVQKQNNCLPRTELIEKYNALLAKDKKLASQKEVVPNTAMRGAIGKPALGLGERATLLKIIGGLSQILAEAGNPAYRHGDGPNRKAIHKKLLVLYPDLSKLEYSTLAGHISDGLALLKK